MALLHKSNVFLPDGKFTFSKKGTHVFPLRQTAWFAKNSLISDEYGFITPANKRLKVTYFGAKFVCTLSQLNENKMKRMALCVMNSHVQGEINQESRYFEKRNLLSRR